MDDHDQDTDQDVGPDRTRERPRPVPAESAPARPDGPDRLLREEAGEALRDRRRALGLRLVDVAERAGVSPQYLSEVERGVKDPSSEVLAAVVGALGLRVADVLAELVRRDRERRAAPRLRVLRGDATAVRHGGPTDQVLRAA